MLRASLSLVTLTTIAACSPNPAAVRVPAPTQTLLRAVVGPDCPARAGGCQPPPGRYAGPLIYADGDSVAMSDLGTGRRIILRPGAGVILEVYRGRRAATAGGVARAAAKSGALGALVGLASSLVGAGLSAAVGADAGLDDWLRAGIVTGGTTGFAAGAVTASQEGEAAWEVVTVLGLRQILCTCADPDAATRRAAAPGTDTLPSWAGLRDR